MSQLLDPALLQRLRRSRLGGRNADPRFGVGERRSRTVGPGIEFADYRDYQPGDDFRYLDRHVYARLGRPVVRQFTVEQQIHVTVLLDASASMERGVPAKFARASEVAGVFAAVAAYGGDRVDIGVCTGRGVRWYPRVSNPRGLDGAFAWLQGQQPGGEVDLGRLAQEIRPKLAAGGMLVVVSDWMVAGVDVALTQWRQQRQELVAVQIVAPDDLDPALELGGAVQLRDAETGEHLDIVVDADVVRRYRAAFKAWHERNRDQVRSAGGTWVTVSSDADLHDTVLRSWRGLGLIT